MSRKHGGRGGGGGGGGGGGRGGGGGGHSKNEYTQGFSYVAQKPKFLQNFGKPPSPPPGARNPRGDGHEALPSRPKDGEWAGGSDDERGRGGGSEDDEWGEVFGGSEDGPQVVVLKEGRHLSKDEVKRERRRAAGKPSVSPPPPSSSTAAPDKSKDPGLEGDLARPKPQIPKPAIHTNKRKLVGAAAGGDDLEDAIAKAKDDIGAAPKKKKKAKAAKGLLSFDEVDE